MKKLFWFKLSVLTFAALIAATYPGEVKLSWLGYTGSFHIFFAFAFLFLLIGSTSIFVRVIDYWKYSFSQKRNLLQQEILERVAIDLEMEKNDSLIIEQLKKLPFRDSPFAQFLESRLEIQQKNYPKALYILESLRSTFFKEIALFNQSQIYIKQENWQEALSCLVELFRSNPSSPKILHRLRLTRLKATAATGTLQPYTRIPSDFAHRQEALEVCCLASIKKDASITLDIYKKVFGYAPDLQGLVYGYASLLYKKGSVSKALQVLKEGYQASPHRVLAQLYIDYSFSKETSSTLEVFKVLESLGQQDHFESLYVLSKAAIEAKLLGQAQIFIEKLWQKYPSYEVWILKSQIDKNLSINDLMSHTLLPNPSWQCKKCLRIETQWISYCPSCKKIDCYIWRVPE